MKEKEDKFNLVSMWEDTFGIKMWKFFALGFTALLVVIAFIGFVVKMVVS